MTEELGAPRGSDKIRILRFVGTLGYGGDQTYLIRIANRLPADRFEQTVLYSGSDDLVDDFRDDIRCVRISEKRLTAGTLSTWLSPISFMREIRRGDYDIVTTHSPGAPQILACLAGRALGRPTVHTIQRPYGNRSKSEGAVIRTPLLRQAAYGTTDIFVALGSYYCEDQATRWRIPRSKLHLSYIGIDLTEFDPDPRPRAEIRRELGLDVDAPTLGVVARLHPRKGLHRAVDCLRHLREIIPTSRLFIVGEGEDRARLESHIAASGLEDCAQLIGARRNVRPYLAAADVVLQTTPNPLNGISSIEAMAMGRPVITVVENPEQERMAADTCDESRNGLFFRLTAPEASAAALAELLRDPSRVEAAGRASREMALERFDIERHMKDLIELYTRIARDRRGRRRETEAALSASS